MEKRIGEKSGLEGGELLSSSLASAYDFKRSIEILREKEKRMRERE